MDQRPSLDYILMEQTKLWALRGTCDRKQVGTILAKDGRSFATGFNGPVAGQPHCTHLADGDSKPCYRSVHAESNAIAFAARNGFSTLGSTAYCSLSPCMACSMLLINGGVIRVVYNKIYRDGAGLELLEASGIQVQEFRYDESTPRLREVS